MSDETIYRLTSDLRKAGLVIRQYQKFHHDLKKATDSPLAVADPNLPPEALTFTTVQIKQEDYQLLQRLKLMVRDFEIKVDG